MCWWWGSIDAQSMQSMGALHGAHVACHAKHAHTHKVTRVTLSTPHPSPLHPPSHPHRWTSCGVYNWCTQFLGGRVAKRRLKKSEEWVGSGWVPTHKGVEGMACIAHPNIGHPTFPLVGFLTPSPCVFAREGGRKSGGCGETHPWVSPPPRWEAFPPTPSLPPNRFWLAWIRFACLGTTWMPSPCLESNSWRNSGQNRFWQLLLLTKSHLVELHG